MWKKIAGGVGALVALAVGFVAVQPSAFKLERQLTIAARPEVVFELVNDFHKWPTWSPWARMDPSAVYTYEGSAGVGSSTSWSGNDDLGKGTQKILASTPPTAVKIDLVFTEPFEAHNTVDFSFLPEGSGTRVVWAMSGENNFFGKIFWSLMGESAVGADFEAGLANLKSVAEPAESARRADELAAAKAAEAAAAAAAAAAAVAQPAPMEPFAPSPAPPPEH